MDFSKKNIQENLIIYGSSHFLIDFVCAGVLFSIFQKQFVDVSTFFYFVILYNILAFGLQFVFGFITDYFKFPLKTTILGCILVIISALIYIHFSLTAVIFAGLGNALFHVGAGSICLNLIPKKAGPSGIYVSTGAIGLLLGTLLAKSGELILWPFLVLLTILCIFMVYTKMPNIDYNIDNKKEINYYKIIVLLVLLSIAIRSLVGFTIIFPWKSNIDLLLLLTFAVVLGKAFGGILADKYGWINIAVGALLLSIPMLSFGNNIWYIGIIGMFLFNITMPITLVAISNTLPGRPAFAFGLTCLALLLGNIPIFMGFKPMLSTSIGIFITILVSSLALYTGLKLSGVKQ